MVGSLTTHVLDTAQGIPAVNMLIHIWYLSMDGEKLMHINQVYTNAQGRTDEALLTDTDFIVGMYELVFEVGKYFRAQKIPTPTPSFLEDVPVRFGVADVTTHYHVPLLVSPWAYSTYRGS